MFSFFNDNKVEAKDNKYSVYDFTFRLKKLEKIILKENLDSILIISGTDSFDNASYT